MITAPKIRAVGVAAIIGLFGVFTGSQTAEALFISISGNLVSFDVDDVGSMFDVSYVCADSSGSPVACPSRDLGDDEDQFNESGEDLIVNIWYEILTFNANMVTLQVTVENATSTDVSTELVSFGFDVVTPDLAAAEVTANNAPSPPDWEARLDAKQGGNLFQSVDICFTDISTGGTDCNNAGGNGLSSGLTDVFDLKLTFDSLITLVTLTTPTIKLAGIGGTQTQTVSTDSLEFTGTFMRTVEVPEPASLLLYGIGLLGLGAFARRRRRFAA